MGSIEEVAFLNQIYPMKDFSRGRASAICEAAQTGLPSIIFRNNIAYRAIITMEDYETLMKARAELEQAEVDINSALASEDC